MQENVVEEAVEEEGGGRRRKRGCTSPSKGGRGRHLSQASLASGVKAKEGPRSKSSRKKQHKELMGL